MVNLDVKTDWMERCRIVMVMCGLVMEKE